MSPLTLEAAYRALKKSGPAPVYYLTGDVDVLKDELVADIVRTAVDEPARDFNVDIRSAGDLDGEALNALIETPPMMAERRAVVVRNLEQWRANAPVWQVLLTYVSRPAPTTVLLLVHGAGEKPHPGLSERAQHVEADGLSPNLLRRWVSARAERAGLSFDEDALEHLVSTVGEDLASLGMEIDKLAAATGAGVPVSLELVSQMVGIRRGETLTDWVQAVLGRDPLTAVALLDVVLPQPGVNGVRMATALGTALIGTRLARALADGGASPREVSNQIFASLRQMRAQGVGLWSEEARRWTAASARWTGAELDLAIAEVREADRALKTSTVSDERAVLAGMLLRLPRPARKTGAAA